MRGSRKIALIILLPVILVISFFAYTWIDYNNYITGFNDFIKAAPGVLQGFQQLSHVTPGGAVIYSLWDYGRAIQEIGGRTPVIKYYSKDTRQYISLDRNPIGNIEDQLYGTFDSSQKVHDVARGFLLPENQSLPIMQKYGATHVMVIPGPKWFDWDIAKFSSIAAIAGYNPLDYINYQFNRTSGQPYPKLTSLAGQATILRLLFDQTLPPQHFTKVYDNHETKIYKINYTTTTTFTMQPPEASQPTYVTPILALTSVGSILVRRINFPSFGIKRGHASQGIPY